MKSTPAKTRTKPSSGLLAVAVTALILFGGLAAWVKFGSPAALNELVYGAVAPFISPTLTTLVTGASRLGEWWIWLLLAIGLMAYPKTRHSIGYLMTAVMLITSAAVPLLKHCFLVPRPSSHRLILADGYGFPSGHATVSAALVVTLLFLVWRSGWSRAGKLLATLVAAAWLVLVGLSRIYLGVHSATDVLGGYTVGVGLATLIIFLWQAVLAKRRVKK